jgi:methyl-accepting chemotaxis protein
MKKLSLNMKISIVLGFLVLGICMVSVNGYYQMNKVNALLKDISTVKVVNVLRTQKLIGLYYVQLSNQKNYIVSPDPVTREKTKKSLIERNTEIVDALIERKANIHSEDELKALGEFEKIYGQWSLLNEKVEALAFADRTREAAEIIEVNGKKLRLSGEEILNKLNKKYEDTMSADTIAAQKDYEDARVFFIISSTMTILLGVGFAVMVLKSLNKSLYEMIDDLTKNFLQVTSASEQIAASSEELSTAASEQAASLEETSASIIEMNSMVQKNSEYARKASQVATGSRESANKGKLVVGHMMEAINDIHTSNQHIMDQINLSNAEIAKIVGLIADIDKKTKIINDIVFQTKLLSFNASVEAARAGENGRGFSVVAEEIGKLAQVSGEAAKEISSMLTDSVLKVEAIVKNTSEQVGLLIGEGKEKINSGTLVAKQCSDVLEEIVQHTVQVTNMTDEIASACQEQSAGVAEITKAMGLLGQVTQTNAATSAQAASSAEDLSSQASALKNVVESLVITVKGEQVEELKVIPARVREQIAANKNQFLPAGGDPRFEEV